MTDEDDATAGTDAFEPDYVTDLQVRFRDIDAMGHVNNAVYATYLEQARADYFADVVGERLHEVATVLVDLTVEYRRPIEWGEDVTVAVAVSALGESSLPMSYEVRADGDLAATAETVQVRVDDEGNATRIEDAWRERMRAASAAGGEG
ncbi:MAG: acyl-CoA thioesterase [Haloferacaceae archaeon]